MATTTSAATSRLRTARTMRKTPTPRIRPARALKRVFCSWLNSYSRTDDAADMKRNLLRKHSGSLQPWLSRTSLGTATDEALNTLTIVAGRAAWLGRPRGDFSHDGLRHEGRPSC